MRFDLIFIDFVNYLERVTYIKSRVYDVTLENAQAEDLRRTCVCSGCDIFFIDSLGPEDVVISCVYCFMQEEIHKIL